MQKHLFLSHLCLLEHGIPEHPENCKRLKAILNALEDSRYKDFLDLSIHRQATVAELNQVHDLTYINHVLALNGQNAYLDNETILTPGSVNAALVAAGIGLELVEQVLENKIQNGFALIRPPGHHARTREGMGFCVFNNIAIAAKKGIAKGLKRILILDWDVHHGNGTQETFYEDDKVFFIDFHQDNLFPKNSGLLSERGKGKGLGYNLNIPFPDSCRDEDYLYAFEKIVKPLAREYQPELILVSAGFDAHESDPLGSMSLTTAGYGILSTKVKKLAAEVCDGKVIFFLEGGYEPLSLAQNVLECMHVLTSETIPSYLNEEEVRPYTDGIETFINEIYESHVKQKP